MNRRPTWAAWAAATVLALAAGCSSSSSDDADSSAAPARSTTSTTTEAATTSTTARPTTTTGPVVVERSPEVTEKDLEIQAELVAILGSEVCAPHVDPASIVAHPDGRTSWVYVEDSTARPGLAFGHSLWRITPTAERLSGAGVGFPQPEPCEHAYFDHLLRSTGVFWPYTPTGHWPDQPMIAVLTPNFPDVDPAVSWAAEVAGVVVGEDSTLTVEFGPCTIDRCQTNEEE